MLSEQVDLVYPWYRHASVIPNVSDCLAHGVPKHAGLNSHSGILTLHSKTLEDFFDPCLHLLSKPLRLAGPSVLDGVEPNEQVTLHPCWRELNR